jgi:hypothetical protein
MKRTFHAVKTTQEPYVLESSLPDGDGAIFLTLKRPRSASLDGGGIFFSHEGLSSFISALKDIQSGMKTQ